VIIPRPAALTRIPGRFILPARLHLTAGPGAARPAELLAEYLGSDRARTQQGPEIRLEIRTDAATTSPEAYHLEIHADHVLLTAPAEAGLFHGVQSLRQLLDADGASLPCLTADDAPLLPWRGVMLDVARHFMPLDFLYELIDQFALNKLNVLHLHLTDDQGWRIEIEGRPRLTEVGAWRTESMVGPAGSDRFDATPHGGFYTRKELGDLVAHASARGVRVVPEIEMPGHARAALAAYPELGVHGDALPVWTSWGVCPDIFGVHDAALDFCREVLGQIIEIFPDRFVHLGGDECPTVQWESDPFSRARAAELGLADPARLHGWFLSQLQSFLAESGRRAVSWDGASPEPSDFPPDMVLAAWLDPAHAVRSIGRGHQVLLTPHQSTFLDYVQRDHPDEPQGQPGGVVTVEDVYAFDPLASGTGERLTIADPFAAAPPEPGVLGAQAQLWTEFLPTPDHVRYAAYPRLCAFAEAAWSTGPRDYADFRARLTRQAPLLGRLGAPMPAAPAQPARGTAESSERPARIGI
jgi:hexosaminidase